MKEKGYKNAVIALTGLMGEDTKVDDGATTWALWSLVDALKDGQMDDDNETYAVTTKGMYLIGDDGYIRYPAVVRVI